MEELDKLTKLFDEYDLKKREWTGFAVKNISVHDWFKYNVKNCFLISTVNCGDIKNIIKFFCRNSEKKMELQHSYQIENYLNHTVEKEKIRKLDSISIIRSYCHMTSNVFERNSLCFCYRCHVKRDLFQL